MSANINEVADNKFDYIIIGGGTSGLTLAARLSENPNVTVAVLEAGSDNVSEPLITVPGQLGHQFGNPNYDWAFMTAPQSHSDNTQYFWPRGKMLGGSSAINFFVWNRPPARDIDAWERLGNPGWNWNRYIDYAKKTERFTPPSSEKTEKYGLRYDMASLGQNGPLDISFAGLMSEADLPLKETFHNLSLPPSRDPYGGDSVGYFSNISTMNPKTHTRTFAAEAFYQPNQHRSNLKLLCGALVLRLLTKGGDGDFVVEGVEFEYKGEAYSVHATGEVILCAGALKTPQILELSGIGDRSVLEPLGIETKIELPGVGANLQEHYLAPVAFEINDEFDVDSLDALKDPEVAQAQMKLFTEKQESLYQLGIGCMAFAPLRTLLPEPRAWSLIAEQRRKIEEKAGSLPPGLKEQYNIQLEVLESGVGADIEIAHVPGYIFPIGTSEPGKSYMAMVAAMNHNFSRGTAHITSADPRANPLLDPHYFEDDFDLTLFMEAVKSVRNLRNVEPLKSFIAKEVLPGPDCKTDEELKTYIKKTLSTVWHTIGTASMLPREKNGVVDAKLRVYGTRNLRVADLSIVPLHIAAHTQATAYNIGEQAADLITGKLFY